MEVSLKEHIEKVIDLELGRVEGSLKSLEKEIERRLQDLVDSRLKFVTILAVVAVIISAITLIMKVME